MYFEQPGLDHSRNACCRHLSVVDKVTSHDMHIRNILLEPNIAKCGEPSLIKVHLTSIFSLRSVMEIILKQKSKLVLQFCWSEAFNKTGLRMIVRKMDKFDILPLFVITLISDPSCLCYSTFCIMNNDKRPWHAIFLSAKIHKSKWGHIVDLSNLIYFTKGKNADTIPK